MSPNEPRRTKRPMCGFSYPHLSRHTESANCRKQKDPRDRSFPNTTVPPADDQEDILLKLMHVKSVLNIAPTVHRAVRKDVGLFLSKILSDCAASNVWRARVKYSCLATPV